MVRTERLSREVWVSAAVGALLRGGSTAVKVEPLAAQLGATKGSFYWHFADRAALLAAALDRWRQDATQRVIERIEAGGGPPRERLRALMDLVLAYAEDSPGELRLFTDDADPVVAAAVAEVTAQRVAYLERLLCEAGQSEGEARRWAVILYSTYLGQAMLTRRGQVPARGHGVERTDLIDALLASSLPGRA